MFVQVIGETHIWTFLSVYNDGKQEIDLHEYFGERLASVEFHVMSAHDGVEQPGALLI